MRKEHDKEESIYSSQNSDSDSLGQFTACSVQ